MIFNYVQNSFVDTSRDRLAMGCPVGGRTWGLGGDKLAGNRAATMFREKRTKRKRQVS